MLLSLLSRRTLEADSRDSYGFAVRPQHLQAFREYGKIYKEEEEERSGKWTSFLQQYSKSTKTCIPVEEHSENSGPDTTSSETKVISENLVQEDDSSGKEFTSDTTKACTPFQEHLENSRPGATFGDTEIVLENLVKENDSSEGNTSKTCTPVEEDLENSGLNATSGETEVVSENLVTEDDSSDNKSTSHTTKTCTPVEEDLENSGLNATSGETEVVSENLVKEDDSSDNKSTSHTTKTCTPVEEHFENSGPDATSGETEVVSENFAKEDDSSDRKSISDTTRTCTPVEEHFENSGPDATSGETEVVSENFAKEDDSSDRKSISDTTRTCTLAEEHLENSGSDATLDDNEVVSDNLVKEDDSSDRKSTSDTTRTCTLDEEHLENSGSDATLGENEVVSENLVKENDSRGEKSTPDTTKTCTLVEEHFENSEPDTASGKTEVVLENLVKENDSSCGKSPSDTINTCSPVEEYSENSGPDATSSKPEVVSENLVQEDDSSGGKSTSDTTKTCTQVEEHLENSGPDTTSCKIEIAPENLVQEDDSSGGKSTPDTCKEGVSEKEVRLISKPKRRTVHRWASTRSTLAPIEKMMGVRVKSNVRIMNEPVQLVQKNLPPIDKKLSLRKKSAKFLVKCLPENEVTSKETYEDIDGLHDFAKSKKRLNDPHKTRELSDSPRQEANNISRTNAPLNASSQHKETSPNDKHEFNIDNNLAGVELFFPWKEELESLVRGGVPKSLRGEVWQAFVGVRSRRVERYYQQLLSLEEDSGDTKIVTSVASNGSTPEKWRKQIEKDLPRTFPGHPALDEEGRNSLRRILIAYARHNPSVGYCQAMNFFAGLLLLLMPEENAFWTLVGIIDDYFDGYYTQEMIESQVDQLVFEELMRERFPKLVNHLDYLGVEVAWVSGPWFLSIFMNMLPWESVLRVWDVLLYEGNRVMLFRTALALIELYGPALITTKDAADAITLLQSLTGSTFDSSQLVFTACMGFSTINEARLEELRTKHRPSVLGIIDERTKGPEVLKDTKRLASKLYSFKQDGQSLLNDPNTNGGLSVNLNDSVRSEAKSSPRSFDEFMCGLSTESEFDPIQDYQEQIAWLKGELCRLMEEKRVATLRAEELETAFLEMVKQDNRRELTARVEQLEHQVILLQQALTDKQDQERALLQVLMQVEQEQRVIEEARMAAEHKFAAQNYEAHVLQEKYEHATASLADMEKRAVMAESMLQATLESGQAKKISSPRSTHSDSPRAGKMIGLLSFGLNWRERNKGRLTNEEDPQESRSVGKGNTQDSTK